MHDAITAHLKLDVLTETVDVNIKGAADYFLCSVMAAMAK